MTEQKRFKLYEHKDNDYILDNPNEHLDFIEMLGDALTSEEIVNLLNELHEENEELRQENKKILDIIDNKITELGMEWYGAEDNSKEEKDANLQLNVLEEIRDELKKII